MSSETPQGSDLLKVGKLEPVARVCERKIGRRPAPATTWRWRVKGVRGGIRLEMAYIHGGWHTTESAFDQFIQEQTAERTGGDTSSDDDAERDDATTRRLHAAGLL